MTISMSMEIAQDVLFLLPPMDLKKANFWDSSSCTESRRFLIQAITDGNPLTISHLGPGSLDDRLGGLQGRCDMAWDTWPTIWQILTRCLKQMQMHINFSRSRKYHRAFLWQATVSTRSETTTVVCLSWYFGGEPPGLHRSVSQDSLSAILE